MHKIHFVRCWISKKRYEYVDVEINDTNRRDAMLNAMGIVHDLFDIPINTTIVPEYIGSRDAKMGDKPFTVLVVSLRKQAIAA